jgi:hypothetical protein
MLHEFKPGNDIRCTEASELRCAYTGHMQGFKIGSVNCADTYKNTYIFAELPFLHTDIP